MIIFDGIIKIKIVKGGFAQTVLDSELLILAHSSITLVDIDEALCCHVRMSSSLELSLSLGMSLSLLGTSIGMCHVGMANRARDLPMSFFVITFSKLIDDVLDYFIPVANHLKARVTQEIHSVARGDLRHIFSGSDFELLRGSMYSLRGSGIPFRWDSQFERRHSWPGQECP